jgi:hypothetical protein
MTDVPEDLPGGGLRFLYELARSNMPIAGDIARIGEGIWAIHGVLPVDGEEILAEFTSYDQARSVLDQLPMGPPGV